MEHGFPHQPSALGYSPSLQLLAIGTRSGAIKLYPSLYLCFHIWRGVTQVSCLNLRQAGLMNGCDAAKSSSGSGMSFSHAVAQCSLALSDTGVCVAVAFHTILLIDSVTEPVGTLSPLTQRHSGLDNGGSFCNYPNPLIQCTRLLLDKTARDLG